MSSFKQFISSKTFLIGWSIFLLILIVVIINQLRFRHSIQSEISDLSKQSDQLQKNNKDLQNFIAYLQTDSYKEQAAREQLDMKKNGEFVYSFAQPTDDPVAAAISAQQAAASESNPHKWWDYFFKAN